ncbi:hypothetical protein QWZ08_00975 [Ferruginibacter paludis]|uniref:hypothetical protein n=1 Tax=Ferruginibacter paludis TaxID=1310417 RepID=UPI0025B59A1C|nr:hypothetical protein [Ferruginibacter paludis]MDN3654174.1 hypothetical protein [Ferruginibacter paludis]
MKKILLAIAFISLGQSMLAQIIKGNLPKNSPVLINAVSQNVVTLFKDDNFGGQSKTFGIGSFALTDSGNLGNMVSSVKIPAGLVAIIYDHADIGGGYGASVDLMEDCAQLGQYNFNDKTAYITVFNAKNTDGLIWVRGKMLNGQFVAGHWERQRANGFNPNGSVAVVAPPTPPHQPDPNDLAVAPQATQAEIDEFNNINTNQMGAGVIGGTNNQPFYYHANQPNETVYKYQKLIDASRLPSGFLQWATGKVAGISVVGGALSMIPYTGKVLIEFADEIKDWLFGSSSTAMWIDAWYPVSANKVTVCGKMNEDVSICSQDYLHTKLTVDKDVNIELTPASNFSWATNNRWLKSSEQKTTIEGEVKMKNLYNINTGNGNTNETTSPHNPLLVKILKDSNVCIYGPWMADILDFHAKASIPLTGSSIGLGKLDINTNNEIHPVNQLWYKAGKDLQLIAIADGNGYFDKTSNAEIAASGLHLTRSFYIPFQLPKPGSRAATITGFTSYEYDIDGIGFDFTNNTPQEVKAQTFSRKYNGVEVLKVVDNSIIKLQKTHDVLFDKIRTRPDGSIQGYIIVETVPLDLPGGSINITVRKITNQQGPIIHNIHTAGVEQ